MGEHCYYLGFSALSESSLQGFYPALPWNTNKNWGSLYFLIRIPCLQRVYHLVSISPFIWGNLKVFLGAIPSLGKSIHPFPPDATYLHPPPSWKIYLGRVVSLTPLSNRLYLSSDGFDLYLWLVFRSVWIL